MDRSLNRQARETESRVEGGCRPAGLRTLGRPRPGPGVVPRLVAAGLLGFSVLVPDAWAQREPRIGYVYPAGGQRGTTFVATVGGQHLGGVTNAFVSGVGVEASVIEHTKPLTQKQINELRARLRELQKSRTSVNRKLGKTKASPGGRDATEDADAKDSLASLAEEIAQLRKKLFNPRKQPNPQIGETVTLRIEIAEDSEAVRHELRLGTPTGLTNPLRFAVGQLPEFQEGEPDAEENGARVRIPAILNGQILPGEVDRYRFEASRGQRLVVSVRARELMPYLADAVPGWFQATLALYDEEGNQLAFADDFRFHPDPVLSYVIPRTGEYAVEIRDALYRGREDFVYRLAVGELPFVTAIFPRGGRAGRATTIELEGWNLPQRSLILEPGSDGPSVRFVSVGDRALNSNRIPFAVDTLPEMLERETNDDRETAQATAPAVIVNGRIDHPDDVDWFRFGGRAGDAVVAEVFARRLDSPLDSILSLTDAAGKELLANDDFEDQGAGLTTHLADSRLRVILPADGTYLLRLSDVQRQGGPAYGYRLRISPPRPDFELRVAPSTINARAGATVPITVHALRRDGYSGDITLRLEGAPEGCSLSGGWVPGGQDRCRMTLTLPPSLTPGPVGLRLVGRAELEGEPIERQAAPADEMMQAFIYRHLVPREQLVLFVSGAGRAPRQMRRVGDRPVRIPAGGTTRVRFRGYRGRLPAGMKLEASEPPEGIAIREVSSAQDGMTIVLAADADRLQPGSKGNLMVNAYLVRSGKSRNGKPQGKPRRVSAGLLPAIPFEVVRLD